jgi:UrcA family protein
MKTMFNRTVSALAAAALAAGTVALTAPAHAAQSEDSVTIAVGDLDLSNPSDTARFERRVRTAARGICGTHQIQPVNMARQVTACQAEVVSNAKADAELALAKSGGPFRLALRAD